MERVFSVDEATSLLPRLTELLTQLQRAQADIRAATRTAQRRVASNGAAPGPPANETGDEYANLLTEITDLGVVVRDPESGLIDFPALRDGDPVYLCWRLGETAIGFWHPRDTGSPGVSRCNAAECHERR